MSKGSKVLVTTGIIIGFLFFFALLTANQKGNGDSTPGVLGIILFLGMIAGIREVWKKPSDDKENDEHQLDKTS
jgi:F0F1-type ATP synthase assembly protein I